MNFAEVSARAQMLRLRQDAFDVLKRYALSVARIACINHGFNTTFRVDCTDGQKFALRINVNSPRDLAAIKAEIAWLEALKHDTNLLLPHIVPTRDGAFILSYQSATLQRQTHAVLFKWLPGRDIDENATPKQLLEVGRTMAILHQHAKNWLPPEGCVFPSARSVFLNSQVVLFDSPMPKTWLETFSTAFAQSEAAHAALYQRFTPQAIHADLHLSNVKWFRGHLSVFDFDDSSWGVLPQDLAISTFYLRRTASGAVLEAALLEGYSQVATLPSYSSAEFEALIVGRLLVLTNDLLDIENSELRGISAKYLESSQARLQIYLETGVFPPRVL